MRDGRGGFAATDSMTGTNGGGFLSGIRTQNLKNMEIVPVGARTRSTRSAFDQDCLSLFHGFKATAAISGDPEPSRFSAKSIAIVAPGGWCVRSPPPLSGVWPGPSSLLPAYAVGCILVAATRWSLPRRRLQIRCVSFMANLEHASDDGRRLRIDHFF